MDSDDDEDESEFIESMSKVREEEIICLDVGGERHYVRRGLLIRSKAIFIYYAFSRKKGQFIFNFNCWKFTQDIANLRNISTKN